MCEQNQAGVFKTKIWYTLPNFSAVCTIIFKKHKISEPLMIKISRCSCGKIKVKNTWKKQTLETALSGQKIDINSTKQTIFHKNNREIIKIKTTLCPTCARASSGYFEGILQLRNKDNKSFDEITDYIDTMIKCKDDVFISKVTELKNGIDIYLSSNRFLKHISKDIQSRFGGELKTSRKLYSRDHQTGKELYRGTILIRLPNFSRGMVIKINKKIVYVKSISGSRITGTDLENCRDVNIPYKEPDDIITKIFNVEVVQKKPYIAVLDPETFQKTRIENPARVKGREIRVIRINQRLLAV